MVESLWAAGEEGVHDRTPFDPKANELVRLELSPDAMTRPL